MRVHRAILIVLILFGLAVGFCGGLEQAPLGRAVYLASEIRKVENQEPVASQIKEVHETLEVCFKMTTVSMYLGVAIVLVSILGVTTPAKRSTNLGGESNQ